MRCPPVDRFPHATPSRQDANGPASEHKPDMPDDSGHRHGTGFPESVSETGHRANRQPGARWCESKRRRRVPDKTPGQAAGVWTSARRTWKIMGFAECPAPPGAGYESLVALRGSAGTGGLPVFTPLDSAVCSCLPTGAPKIESRVVTYRRNCGGIGRNSRRVSRRVAVAVAKGIDNGRYGSISS